MPRLLITEGAGVGRDHAVATECVVGRAPGADFIVDDNLVSRRHARIYREGDGYVVEDLGSRNGTVVNGKRVARARIVDGDTITVGSTAMTFRQKTLEQAAAGGKPLGAPPARPAAPVPPTVPVKPFAKPAADAGAPAAPAVSTSSNPPPPPPPPKPPGDGQRKRRLIS
jgi:hypothetical protein